MFICGLLDNAGPAFKIRGLDHVYAAIAFDWAESGIVLAGRTNKSDEYQLGAGWVVRLDPQGDEVWRHILEDKKDSRLWDVAVLTDGDFVAAG